MYCSVSKNSVVCGNICTLYYGEVLNQWRRRRHKHLCKRKKELNKLVRLASRNLDLDADKRFASFLDKLDDLASLTNAPIYGKTAAMA